MSQDNSPPHIKLDERNLDQVHGFGWEIIDLDNKRTTWTPCVEFLPEIF